MASLSPPRRQRPVDISINTHILPPIPPCKDNWCLFPPASPMASPKQYQYQHQRHMSMPRKPIAPSAPPTTPRYIGNTILASRNAEKLTEVCTFVPQALRRRSDTSDNSPPGLSDDHTGSSDSDASSDEERYHATMTDLWNTYYENPIAQKSAVEVRRPTTHKSSTDLRRSAAHQKSSMDLRRPALPQLAAEKKILLSRKSIGDLRRPSVTQFSSEPEVPTLPKHIPLTLITPPRKSSIEPFESTTSQKDLHRSPATTKRLTRRATESGPAPTLSSLSSPLPPLPTTTSSTTTTTLPRNHHGHETWPLRCPPPPLSLYPSNKQPGSIPRPSTAPGHRRDASTALKSRSPTPTTPTFPSMVEKSVFEYDDDEDNNAGRKSTSLAAKFHIRSLSAGSKKDVPAVDGASTAAVGQQRQKNRTMRRSASEVIKGIFGLNG